MKSASEPNSFEPKDRFQSGCPYIGRAEDPQNHVKAPGNKNYCHLVRPPQEVARSHQQSYCLAQQFPDCAVYLTSGEGDIPLGIFEKSGRQKSGSNLAALFAIPARQKSEASADPDHSTAEIDPVPTEDHPEAVVDEIELPSTSEQELDPIHDSETEQPVDEEAEATDVNVAEQDSVVLETYPDPDAAVFTGYKTAIPDVAKNNKVRDILSLWIDKATSAFQSIKYSPKDWKAIGIIVALAVVVLLLIVGATSFYHNRQLQAAAQKIFEDKFALSLVTAVQEMSVISDAWGRAESFEIGDFEAGALKPDQALAEPQMFSQNTAKPNPNILDTSPNSSLDKCQNIEDAKLQIVSGPEISPPQSTQYRFDMQPPAATWVVKNAGTCSWSQLSFWSVLENTLVQPTIKRNGSPVAPFADGRPMVISPGEQIDVILEFPMLEASYVDEEWVGVVDGLSLITDPHFVLKVNKWIVYPNLDPASP